MRIDQFDYELPRDLIADRPPPERDGGRLLVLDAEDARSIEDGSISQLPDLIPRGALVVVNDTRVLPARLFATKPSGGRVEIMLVERLAKPTDAPACARFRAMVRASKPMRPGAILAIENESVFRAHVVGPRAADGLVEIELDAGPDEDVDRALERAGHVPLPPYLGRADEASDRERYQTVFARVPGAFAAPTAGLHLTKAMLARMAARDCEIASVTLHVSLGTFQPVAAVDLDDHPMHAEHFCVPSEVATQVARARERRAPVVAIGTTAVRALESAADPDHAGHVLPIRGETRLLIQPGFRFRLVDHLVTNFHLPRSTLLALVSAFAGRTRILEAYAHAVRSRYRFFSYGDAMLLRRQNGPA